ncbi:MAG: hypothetical protein MUQ00_12440 [Candidatus Aminicenantes bacterium]|nr:hypothetical protein [Candidatus Aminicenantes bacterium]
MKLISADFIPSTQAFGNYIDRYFNIRDGKFYIIKSPEEFIDKFNADDRDDFKFPMSPKRDSDVSKFDEL